MIRHILALTIVMCPAWAPGQEPRAVPGETPEVRKLLDTVRDQYRLARTYRDRYVVDMVFEGEGTQHLGFSPPQAQRLLFSAPDRIRLEAEDFTLVCSGRRLWERVVPLEQYIETTVPQRLNLDEVALAQFEAFRLGRHPIAVLLTDSKADFLKTIGEITEFKPLKLEKRLDEEGALLSGRVDTSLDGGPSINVPFTAWFDANGLLAEITYDLTKRYQDLLDLRGLSEAGIRLTRAVQRKRFLEPELNGVVTLDEMTYKPGPYDRKVAAFEPVTQQEMQQRLIGRPAPSFRVLDLEGKQVALSDFRGKVVMLDFWSTSCGPCIMSFPHIEELHRKYAKESVAILGVNGDALPPVTQPSAATQPAARFEPIARFLKAKKITYPQLMDVDSEISEAYRVSGIPCVIMLDKAGVIRRIHMGYRADAVRAYGADIDQLLKDEVVKRDGPTTQASGR